MYYTPLKRRRYYGCMRLVIEQPQARETTIKAISIIIGATIIKENKIIKANKIKESYYNKESY